MPKKHRLSGVEIRSTRPKSRKHGVFFTLSVSPMGTIGKVTCVVSKKVSPLATGRNLVKRRCRAALLPHLPVLPAGVYIFTAKREAADASFSEIQKDINDLVRQVAL